MKRFAGPIVLVAVLILTAWIAWTSPEVKKCLQETNKSYAEQALQENVPGIYELFVGYRRCAGAFIHESGESIIAIFTIILGVTTWALWRATRDLVKGAEDTSRHQLRAYVLINSIQLSLDPQNGNRFGAAVNVQNFGNTPADKVNEWASIAVAKYPPEGGFPDGGNKKGGVSNLGPTQHSIQIPTCPKLSEHERNEIAAGTAAIYAWGAISYVDIFGERHETNYRYMCNGQGLALGLFRPCEEGNTYT